MSLAKQELLTLPEHLSSSTGFNGFVLLNLNLLCGILWIIVCLFIIFLLLVVVNCIVSLLVVVNCIVSLLVVVNCLVSHSSIYSF